jgi:prevent-host-death family protein
MAAALKFRNSQGELVDIVEVAATRFKNEFGAMFEQAALGGAVAITKHDAPKAVLISYDEFRALMRARSPGLDDLGAQFDALLAGMQAPRAKKGMAAAFDASPAKLGRAAVKAARKRLSARSWPVPIASTRWPVSTAPARAASPEPRIAMPAARTTTPTRRLA